MTNAASLIEAIVRAEPASGFLDRALQTVEEPESVAFRAMFASVSRRLGAAAAKPVTPPPDLASVSRPHWTLTDWTRALLLLRAFEQVPAATEPALVLRTFEGGALGEQESVLRILPLLPEPGRFLETGLAGCRTNAKQVFEAIACDNPFPAAHFPELHFNQLVMKSLFMEASVSRIEGLAARRGPELVRMAHDYASERRAAGRPVPTDVALVLEGTS